eukprot:1285673-Rhodomonas_salina.4
MTQAYQANRRASAASVPKFEGGRFNNETDAQFEKRKADEEKREEEQKGDIERRSKVKAAAQQSMLAESKKLGNKYMNTLAELVPQDVSLPVKDIVQVVLPPALARVLCDTAS